MKPDNIFCRGSEKSCLGIREPASLTLLQQGALATSEASRSSRQNIPTNLGNTQGGPGKDHVPESLSTNANGRKNYNRQSVPEAAKIRVSENITKEPQKNLTRRGPQGKKGYPWEGSWDEILEQPLINLAPQDGRSKGPRTQSRIFDIFDLSCTGEKKQSGTYAKPQRASTSQPHTSRTTASSSKGNDTSTSQRYTSSCAASTTSRQGTTLGQQAGIRAPHAEGQEAAATATKATASRSTTGGQAAARTSHRRPPPPRPRHRRPRHRLGGQHAPEPARAARPAGAAHSNAQNHPGRGASSSSTSTSSTTSSSTSTVSLSDKPKSHLAQATIAEQASSSQAYVEEQRQQHIHILTDDSRGHGALRRPSHDWRRGHDGRQEQHDAQQRQHPMVHAARRHIDDGQQEQHDVWQEWHPVVNVIDAAGHHDERQGQPRQGQKQHPVVHDESRHDRQQEQHDERQKQHPVGHDAAWHHDERQGQHDEGQKQHPVVHDARRHDDGRQGQHDDRKRRHRPRDTTVRPDPGAHPHARASHHTTTDATSQTTATAAALRPLRRHHATTMRALQRQRALS